MVSEFKSDNSGIVTYGQNNCCLKEAKVHGHLLWKDQKRGKNQKTRSPDKSWNWFLGVIAPVLCVYLKSKRLF